MTATNSSRPILDGQQVVIRHQIGEDTVTLIAEDLREERTGVHGLVKIGLGSTILAHDTFNITRDPDRTRLSNSAAKMMPKTLLDEEYPKERLKHDLDIFLLHAWEVWQGQYDPVLEAGDDDIEIEWLANGLVMRGGGTILYGPPGFGKSYVAQTASVVIDAGLEFCWDAVGILLGLC